MSKNDGDALKNGLSGMNVDFIHGEIKKDGARLAMIRKWKAADSGGWIT